MREIKFRGKRKNGEWTHGSLLISSEGDTHIVDNKTWEKFKVDPETVGQYTGLDDLYEGGKLEITCNFEHRKGVVTDVVDIKNYMWGCNDWSLSEIVNHVKRGNMSYKVVGNIHE